MEVPPESIGDVTKAIQLALAPVFLLTGIAGLLNVMTGRLSRIIDRGRAISERTAPTDIAEQEAANRELQCLEQRRRLPSAAITACTIAALLLCVTIVLLFLEAMLLTGFRLLVGGLFTASTLALIVSLAVFLREVHLAMQMKGFQTRLPGKNRPEGSG